MSASFLDAPGPDTLAERLAEDMRQRWAAGERPRTEDYLARCPELRDHPEAVAELIYEEVCLRKERGESGVSSEVLRRFPQWADPLRVLLDCHRALEIADGPDFPSPGERLGDFHLLAELGRGSQGRVFLATQPTLADRPVVLKLTPLTGAEHLTLARLQHTHIVPLYSAAADPERRLRVLCLPYFGGATLTLLLKRLRDKPAQRRTGGDLLHALDAVPSPAGFPGRGPARDWLARASWVEAVCWVGACLAEALHYAHQRGLVHLDLKPSNVLLAADGTPMLLDFHLARGPVAAGSPAPAWLGGTPAYLSPEQAAAMAAVRGGGPVVETVDGRSDVFSLGLVLHEALAGELPQPDKAERSLRAYNPHVSVGLADTIARCLEPRSCDRYPDAAILATDLRSHLAARPLREVANRDPLSPQRKQRRRPLALLGLLLLIVGGLALAGVHVARQLANARAALEAGREQVRQGRYAEAAVVLRRGRDLAADLPLGGALARELSDELSVAERAEVAAELHTAAERIRGLFGVESLPPARLRIVARRCGEVWERRGQISAALQAGLPAGVEQQARNDLLELAVLEAHLRVALARPRARDAARREALRVLDEVEKLGPSPVVHHERRLLAEALGLANVAREAARLAGRVPARSAWEHYALGCSFLRHGELERAAEELKQAVELAPQDLWANFYKGGCALRLGRHEEALICFAACVALAPHRASCFHNRGLAHEALGHLDEALRDYDRALRLDPGLAEVSLSRGLLHARAGRADAAFADLDRALDGGANLAACHYGLALAHLARHDPAAARLSLDEALRHDPAHAQARELRDALRKAP